LTPPVILPFQSQPREKPGVLIWQLTSHPTNNGLTRANQADESIAEKLFVGQRQIFGDLSEKIIDLTIEIPSGHNA
jgi:hypothetical protein